MVKSLGQNLLLGLAVSIMLCGCAGGSIDPNQRQPINRMNLMENLPEQIEVSIQELKLLKHDDGASRPPEGHWQSKEVEVANFILRDNPRFRPPGTFSKQTTALPIPDVLLTVVNFKSPDQAVNAVEQSLMVRSGAFQPKEAYNGASLHKYLNASGEVVVLICSFGSYVIEISTPEGDTELAMKVVDATIRLLEPAN